MIIDVCNLSDKIGAGLVPICIMYIIVARTKKWLPWAIGQPNCRSLFRVLWHFMHKAIVTSVHAEANVHSANKVSACSSAEGLWEGLFKYIHT